MYAYLQTIAKKKVYIEFDLSTLSPKSAATHQHSFRVKAYHQVQQWYVVALDPTIWGRRVKNGPTVYLQYIICLTSANQICTFFKVTQLFEENISFLLILIYIKLKTTANFLLVHIMLKRTEIRTFREKKLNLYVHPFGCQRHLKNDTDKLRWIPLFRHFGKTRHRIFWDFQDSS